MSCQSCIALLLVRFFLEDSLSSTALLESNSISAEAMNLLKTIAIEECNWKLLEYMQLPFALGTSTRILLERTQLEESGCLAKKGQGKQIVWFRLKSQFNMKLQWQQRPGVI